MRDDTKQALEDSIAHHKRVRDDRHGEELGAHTCALCKLFHSASQFACERFIEDRFEMCPVKNETMRAYCEGSPYYPYEGGEYDDPDLEECRLDRNISDERFTEMENEEIDFLENLLPKES